MLITKNRLSLVFLASFSLLTLSAYAKSQFFNDDGTLVMKSMQQKAKVYQIWNISAQKMTLDVVNKASGVQAGYASALDPHNGSVFIYSGMQPSLLWTCMVPASKTAQKIACDTVLKVSNYPTRLLQLKPTDGNYWLFENKPAVEFKPTLKSALASHHLLK